MNESDGQMAVPGLARYRGQIQAAPYPAWGGPDMLVPLIFIMLVVLPVMAAGPVVPSVPEPALVEAFAKAAHLSREDAAGALKWNHEAGVVIKTLREQYKKRLAGVWVEYTPVRRIVVRLKGPDPVPEEDVQNGGQSVRVNFLPGATYTLEELLAVMAANSASLKSAFPELKGTGINEKTGAVNLYVAVRGQEVKAVRKRAAALSGWLAVPLHIVVVG